MQPPASPALSALLIFLLSAAAVPAAGGSSATALAPPSIVASANPSPSGDPGETSQVEDEARAFGDASGREGFMRDRRYPATERTRGRSERRTEGERYDNTYAKDFIMDAPWRVVDEATPIPLTIILKDCDTDDIRQLHWCECRDVTGGASTVLWHHDYGDEQIGNDPAEHNYWTWVTTVAEGHPSLPNGTLLTPAALGYAPGQAIDLRVQVYYRDDIFNYTETRYLRVQVGSGPFPWPAGWYGGDTHCHTMYTNNIAEFGAPLPAVRLTAPAIGLAWLAVTDHSCDLDETGDGSFSYATQQWEYTVQSPAGIQTVYRDVTAAGSTWEATASDIALLEGPDFRLARGVEINLASVDPDSWEKTLHALFFNPAYIDSPRSGAFGERPVHPSLPDGLDALDPAGFAYAAHPLYDLATEWGGTDWGVNGSVWGDTDLAVALEREGFRGLEAFNSRATRQSADQNNPWPDFDAGQPADDPYPGELLAGIAAWDGLLAGGLASWPPRTVFLAGGSDAHGDFNYSAQFNLDSYATDNALGKVQTVVRVPGAYGPGDLPPTADLLGALAAGRSLVTDGPFLEIGVDRDGDGDWYEEGDLEVGDQGWGVTGLPLTLRLRWSSLAEFGPLVSVKVIAGNAAGTSVLLEFDPSSAGQGYGGGASFDLGAAGLAGPHYLRAECLTADGGAGHRAYTNPIWVDFLEAVETVDCAYVIVPAQGTLPFIAHHQVTLASLYMAGSRRAAARIDVALAGGASYSNWRSGYVNLQAGAQFTTQWVTNLPASGQLLGPSVFTLQVEDVTPSPYNQPPYAPSGDTAAVTATVTGLAP